MTNTQECRGPLAHIPLEPKDRDAVVWRSASRWLFLSFLGNVCSMHIGTLVDGMQDWGGGREEMKSQQSGEPQILE